MKSLSNKIPQSDEINQTNEINISNEIIQTDEINRSNEINQSNVDIQNEELIKIHVRVNGKSNQIDQGVNASKRVTN